MNILPFDKQSEIIAALTEGVSILATERLTDVHRDLGTIEKHYNAPQAVEVSRRYSPAEVVAITSRAVIGAPRHIPTSYVERENLSLRVAQRRFTRPTSGFSKKLANHCAAVALYAAYYNFCRVNEALRVTPVMQLSFADHISTVSELVQATLTGELARREAVA